MGEMKQEEATSLPTYAAARRQFEAIYVRRALALSNGNIASAARLAGKDRKAFYTIMDRSGVPRPHMLGRPGRPPGRRYVAPPIDPTKERWGVA